MDIKTFRAKSMRDALDLVRCELGPSAAVLHTREVNSGPLRRLMFGRRYEVAASAGVNVPSRLAEVPGVRRSESSIGCGASSNSFSVGGNVESHTSLFGVVADANHYEDYRARYRDDFRQQVAGQLDELQVLVEKFRDGFLPAQWKEVKEFFERFKHLARPDLIFTHEREDRHQDHRVVCELT